MKFIRRKMMSNMENAIYFFDLETTGLLKHNGRIIEIACCKMVYEPNGKFYSSGTFEEFPEQSQIVPRFSENM